ncbi:MAG: helix-hairpin-helix domain-containing protein [Bacteroidaceae bacterium]|nr:helix-hairpin-helix domain-containing protein [Bacteroidaceae bacterium]
MAYFEPTSGERRGVVVLGVALLLGFAVLLFVQLSAPQASGDAEKPGEAGASLRSKRSSQLYYACPERKVETFDFDPNEADSTTLLRLGFAPFQVRGIYRYRSMGGRYHEPADVQRIPGMTNELWERLAGHIRIHRRYQYVTPPPRSRDRLVRSDFPVEAVSRANRDTLRFPEKLRPGQTVSLNEADTTALKKIPGVGSYYAARIVRYREALGGYVSAEQLLEIEGIPDDIGQWVSVDTAHLRRIDVNHATKSQLVRHPYLRVYRADDIWQWRHNYGPLRSADDLRRLPNFTDDDVQRLLPYLLFR